MSTLIKKDRVVGRFAPSPTGHLHLGSLVTAVASYCIAKQQGGLWRLRIDDLDVERCRAEFADSILHDLTRLGLHWDDAVRYQSANLSDYHAAIDQLKCLNFGHVSYGCDCSRKSIANYNQQHNLPANHYSQRCYGRYLPYTHAVRVLMPNQQTIFFDQLQGTIFGNPQREHGDFVIRRRAMSPDRLGMINYMLAVVIDDVTQGVNQVVRGIDILPLTIPQLVIADYLKLPLIAQYHHLPVLVNADGQKLSKQTLAQPIRDYPASALLQLTLSLLKQPCVTLDTPDRMLAQAVDQWDSTPLKGQHQFFCKELPVVLQAVSSNGNPLGR